MNRLTVQRQWVDYLTNTPTYGTYADRLPEYTVAAETLLAAGLVDDDLVVDVGAGWCDFDQALRTKFGWRGRYLPVDGAIQGVDLNNWSPDVPADFYVSMELIEHLDDPYRLLADIVKLAGKAVVVLTPNPDVVDVLAVDPTHVTPIHAEELQVAGFTVTRVTLNPARGENDTLVGVWQR